MAWIVLVHPDAEEELNDLPSAERVAVGTAIDKLRAIGCEFDLPAFE